MTATLAPQVLRGPDADRFRIKHYGARWYIDPLPACPIAPATTDSWPSVTTVKKAWSKPFRKKLPTGEAVPLDAYWAAEFTLDHLPAVTQLAASDTAAAMALICGAGARTLNRAADRGTGVHTVLETLGAGQQVDELLLDDVVRPYLPACRAFIADWHPTWVATEFVAINRTLGFGGTADAIITIDLPGVGPYTCLVDWKSRGGAHGCYEDEIAQLGGYSLAEYIIVIGPDGRPTRHLMPNLDGVLVVSLNAEGYQATPADLDGAQEAFGGMLRSWAGQREGQKAARTARAHPIMLPAAPPAAGDTSPGEHLASPADGAGLVTGTADAQATTSLAASADRLTWIRQRVATLMQAGHEQALVVRWHPDVPTLGQPGITDHHIEQVATWCAAVEADHGIPFGATDPLWAAFAAEEAREAAAAQAAVPDASPAGPARDEMAEHWAQRGRELLAQFDDDNVILAIAECAGLTVEDSRMTADRYRNLEAVADQCAADGGAVLLQGGPDDGDWIVIPAPNAADLMAAAAGTKGEARDRAARLAKRAGRIAPRSLAKAAEKPLLVALVVAGHGADTPTNDTTDTETTNP